MFKKKIAFVFFSLISIACISQEKDKNLVSNYSFEEYQPGNNPHGSSKGFVVNEWYSPTAGTPDFFIKWSYREGDRDNWPGFKLARTGDCYMGLMTRFVFSYSNSGNSREYVTAKLKRPLVKNQKYQVTFYTQLAQNCIYATTGLGAYFSNEKPDTAGYTGVLAMEPQVEAIEYGILDNTQSWRKISGSFRAKGGEQYITIGNFRDNYNTDWMERENVGKYNIYYFAYYFIEDVSVEPVNYFENDLALGQSNILDNLMFKRGEDELLSGSIEELEKLVKLMREYPRLEIEIAGHTDDVGSEPANLKLSTLRAKAVANYLIEQGVAANRIRSKGYGSRSPIADNSSEEGRRKNRRVEFIVTNI